MSYGSGGEWLGFDVVTDPGGVAAQAERVRQVRAIAVPLNVYLARAGLRTGA